MTVTTGAYPLGAQTRDGSTGIDNPAAPLLRQKLLKRMALLKQSLDNKRTEKNRKRWN